MRLLRHFGYTTSTVPPTLEDHLLFWGILLALGFLFRLVYHRYVLRSDQTEIRIYTPRHGSQNFQIRIDISNIPSIDLSAAAATAASATAVPETTETKKTV